MKSAGNMYMIKDEPERILVKSGENASIAGFFLLYVEIQYIQTRNIFYLV